MASQLSQLERGKILLTEREVASIFRVTPRTIRRWAGAGWFDPVRIGGVLRFRAADIELFIDPPPSTSEAPAVTPGPRETRAGRPDNDER